MAEQPNLFYKIVHANPPFLVPRRLTDIGKENFGVPCERPLVLFSDAQEALEKSLWFYAHNILPLVGEANNLAVTVFSARTYGIDAVVSELPIIAEFLPRLGAEYDLDRIRSLTLIGCRFVIGDLAPFTRQGRSVRALLALPAIGAFAESCPERLGVGELIFHADATSEVATDGGSFRVTKTIELLEPVVGRDTGIAARAAGKCACGRAAFVLS